MDENIKKAMHSLFYVRSIGKKRRPHLHDAWFLFLVKEYGDDIKKWKVYEEEGGHGYKRRSYVLLTKSGVFLNDELFSLEGKYFYELNQNFLLVYKTISINLGYINAVFLGELWKKYELNEVEEYIKFFNKLKEEDPLIVKLKAIKTYKELYNLPLEEVKLHLHPDLAILFEEFLKDKGKEELYKKIEELCKEKVNSKASLISFNF